VIKGSFAEFTSRANALASRRSLCSEICSLISPKLGNQKYKRSDLQHPTLMIRGIRHLLDSVTVLYGLVVILVMYGAVALSPAESAARYTTAGGHYH